jgi:hypothetical protein
MSDRCTRALDALGDAKALAALRTHLETCAECRGIVDAHAALRAVQAPRLEGRAAERIRATAHAELAAHPRPRLWWSGALALGAVALASAAAGALHGARGNLASPGRQIAVAAALVACIGCASWAALSPRRRSRGFAIGASLVAAAVVAAAGSGVFPAWCGGFWESGMGCARAVATWSLPTCVAALLFQRSAAWSFSRALVGGLAAGAAGALALHPHCPIGQASHLALFHVVPWFAVAAALALIQRRLPVRSFAP